MRLAAAATLIAALLLIAGSAPAQAQYRWKDASGQTHVSDLPPPRDIPDQNVLQRPAGPARQAQQANPAGVPANAASTAARSPVDPELEARRKRADDQARARGRSDDERVAAQRADNCQRARQQLAMLDTGRRLQRNNAQGERTVVDESARADELQTARQVVASDCR